MFSVRSAIWTSGEPVSAGLFWNSLTHWFFSSFNKNTIFIFPAIPNSAPLGLESTGEPKYIAPWTALSGPIVSCSTGLDDNKMPVGILLCGHPFRDRFLSSFCMDIYNKSEYFSGLKL